MADPKTHRIEDLSTEFLRCRAYGHSWDQIPSSLAAVPLDRRMFFWYDVLRCVVCGTERYDGVDINGQVQNRSYNYPHGYQTSFTLTRSWARKELLMQTRARNSQ